MGEAEAFGDVFVDEQDDFIGLIDFAAERNLLLRFIELMPVTTNEVLNETTFLPVRKAKRAIEAHYGNLIPLPGFRTNGPQRKHLCPRNC